MSTFAQLSEPIFSKMPMHKFQSHMHYCSVIRRFEEMKKKVFVSRNTSVCMQSKVCLACSGPHEHQLTLQIRSSFSRHPVVIPEASWVKHPREKGISKC